MNAEGGESVMFLGAGRKSHKGGGEWNSKGDVR